MARNATNTEIFRKARITKLFKGSLFMAIQDIQIRQFFPKSAAEADIAELVALQLISFQERNPGDKLPPENLLRKQLELLDENPMASMEVYLAQTIEGRIDGLLMMGFPRPEGPEYESQKHMGMASIFVRPEARRQGIGRFLMRKIVEAFQSKGISLIQGDTSSDAGRAFAKLFSGTVGLETKTNRAYTKDMDWEMIRGWVDETAKANPDVKIEFIKGLPGDEDIDAYCHLFTEVHNQQPMEELEGLEMSFTPEKMRQMLAQQHERGVEEFVMISREANGDISGLSEIAYNPQRPHVVQQGLTGVQQTYRGRGLGKWLKAAMLLYVHETYPDVQYIDTTNASVNEAMLSINERLGFKLHRYNSLFKLQIEDVVKSL
jgi:mycothiol synthase